MIQLSKSHINLRPLPEKILQFGTGILLRGLPDYFVHQANVKGIFNGKIVVVKSTSGGTEEFHRQDHLYTLCVRGIENRNILNENTIIQSISRVLMAKEQWKEILALAERPEMQIIISNTTEVGIQFIAEDIFQNPPASFPAKLCAWLFERYQFLGYYAPLTVVIPTELIPDNGKKLREIFIQVMKHNGLSEDFNEWLEKKVVFCNSLVDRIVTQPTPEIIGGLPYEDRLAIQTEPYRLWAIEGDQNVKEVLSFAGTDNGLVIAEDITFFRERKLRLLNGTHTLCVCLGFLKGLDTVGECMQDIQMHGFIQKLMYEEIIPTLLLGKKTELEDFAEEVLDRFRNPFTAHHLLNIALQESSKMKTRNIPTLLRYYEKFNAVPEIFAKGFAAYLLFMRSEKSEDGKYYGNRKGIKYLIQDDFAGYFCELWNNVSLTDTKTIGQLVQKVHAKQDLWETDLNSLPGWTEKITHLLLELISEYIPLELSPSQNG